MVEGTGAAIVDEPGKLGFGCKALVFALIVLTAGLAVGTVVAIRAKRVEERRKADMARTRSTSSSAPTSKAASLP
ncbi:hypothetical protein HY251_20860 [bacterium]|nr:hypothetical protein [bacterium]